MNCEEKKIVRNRSFFSSSSLTRRLEDSNNYTKGKAWLKLKKFIVTYCNITTQNKKLNVTTNDTLRLVRATNVALEKQ